MEKLLQKLQKNIMYLFKTINIKFLKKELLQIKTGIILVGTLTSLPELSIYKRVSYI